MRPVFQSATKIATMVLAALRPPPFLIKTSFAAIFYSPRGY
jgi:hypothetical protein